MACGDKEHVPRSGTPAEDGFALELKLESIQSSQNRLRRELGPREAIALGVGGTIGGGIFVLVGTSAGHAGPAAPISFVIAFIGALVIATPYAELACLFPRAGGGYAFVRAVLSRPWAFLMGWCFWGSYVFMSGFITLGFGSHMHVLIGLPPIAGAVFVIVASTAVNLTGIRLSGLTQILVVLLAVAALVGFGLLGAPHVTAARFSPFLPHGLIGVVSAALPAFLAFAGFDMVAAAGEEVKEPERTLPRAILATLLIVLGMYLLVIVVAIGVMPWSALGSSPAPLVDAAHTVAGAAGAQLVAVAAVLTMAATTNAVLIVMSRVAFAMARDGLLPSPLAAVAARTGAPWIAILASSAMVILVALTGSVPLAASIGGFLYVSHFVLPLVTLVVLRRRGGPRPRFRTPLAPLVLGMAFTICAIFLFAGGAIGSLGGLAWLGLGMCSFALVTWRRARKRSEPATEKIDSVESAPP